MWEKWLFFPIFLRYYSHKPFLIRESTACDFLYWNAFECPFAQFHWKECLPFTICVQAGPSPLPGLGGNETSPNPCSSIERDSSWVQAPRGLCPQRCSVKCSVTCWSPTQTVCMLRCLGCVNTRQELSAGPALLSPQSKRFSAAKRSFAQA